MQDERIDILTQIWSAAGVVSPDARWQPMSGGRSNPIWRISSPDQPQDLVCKLFQEGSATPLFANDGMREVLALTALQGTGIAPELIAYQDTILGICVVYKHVEGTPWRGDVSDVAQLLAQLHRVDIPTALPEHLVTPEMLVSEGAQLSQMSGAVLPPAPTVQSAPPLRNAFLHGDVVPGNILETPRGLRLIDWQCPASGDTSADIAVFLSPAMQTVYGHRALEKTERDAFLESYETAAQESDTVTRYRALAPLYHWRMAAYCAWKAAQGDDAYGLCVDMELAASDQA